jgi:hypothetical protein
MFNKSKHENAMVAVIQMESMKRELFKTTNFPMFFFNVINHQIKLRVNGE